MNILDSGGELDVDLHPDQHLVGFTHAIRGHDCSFMEEDERQEAKKPREERTEKKGIDA